ncbi:MAG TPA: CpsD/CapB family tyrosine-protein kinase [Clostridiaceae bacterium]
MENINLYTIKDPKSPMSEAYRTLRSNIQFSSFDKDLKTIMITSSGPGEGKSTTSSNLAVVMAMEGKRTLLIDCDLRKPRLHKNFGVTNTIGLSSLMIGEAKLEEVMKKTSVEGLFILTTGKRPPNPTEMLSSAKMKQVLTSLREVFDCIIFDTPPIIMVTDAQLVSQYADGCILVVASGEADREAAIKAKQLLEKAKANIIGVVLNKIDATSSKYYGHYYHYYYGNDKTINKKKNIHGKK